MNESVKITFCDFRECPQPIEVFSLFYQLFDKHVIHPGHVIERGYDIVSKPAFLHFIVYLPFVLYGVAPELTHSALPDGVVHHKNVKVTKPFVFRHGSLPIFLVNLRQRFISQFAFDSLSKVREYKIICW